MSDLRQLSFARNDKACGVSDGITWEIKPLNRSVGVISFSDSKNIRILDNTNGNVPVNPIPADKNIYVFNWTDDYTVYLNTRIILTLRQPRIMEISVVG